jgi:glycosyltransferase involved in cell wall biosynthesis
MTEKKLKILYLITKSNFGGAQRYVFDLATSLPQDQCEVAVAFGEGKTLEDKLHGAGVRTIRIESLQRDVSLLKDFKVLFELWRLFRRERPDVIHLNSSKIGGLGGLAGRLARVPHIVFTGHGWAFNEERTSASKVVITFLHWVTIMLAHVTIAVSERTSDQIKKIPLAAKKIITIHNGVGETMHFPKHEARKILMDMHPKLREVASKYPDAFWIGTISELHKNKGLDYMLGALAEIINIYPRTFFVCLGNGEMKDELEKQIEELCPDNAFLLGFVPEAQQYLKAFDTFTLTSRTEGFPYAILEAGQVGLPIIASHVGGIPEIITDMQSGILTQPRRAQDIAHAVIYLLDNPEKRVEYGRNIQEIVSTKFSLETMVQRTIELYKKVIH